MIYHLSDIQKIVENRISYILSPEIINHVKKIESELGILHTPVKTYDSSSRSHARHYTNSHHNRNQKEDLSWENVRNFKTTKIEKKEGLEKKINDVRSCINKMSAKNYETQRDAIFAFILEEESLEKFANVIFDIASTNKFYSEIYAKLYRELIDLYPIFQKVMDVFLQKYMDSLSEIKYADPNVDYDLFCIYTKQSDKRKATAQFIVHMMREKILSQEYLIQLVDNLIQKVRENMDLDDHVNEVEEITELVNIFILQSHTFISPTTIWMKCINSIQEFSKYKLKDKKSLSSRIIFKYTDLVTTVK